MSRLTLDEVVEMEKRHIKKMFPPGTLDLVSILPDPETGLVVVVFRAAHSVDRTSFSPSPAFPADKQHS